MSMNVRTDGVQWNKQLSQVVKDAWGGDRTLLFAAVTWHKLITPFTPMLTGALCENVNYRVNGGQGEIEYNVPYARRQYYGEGFNFSRMKHPLATHHWDEAAKAAGKFDDLIKDVQAFVKRG